MSFSRTRIESFILPNIVTIIFFLGFLVNLMLIIVILRNRNMRNKPNTFIVSLALADLLILTNVSFFLIHYTFEGWPERGSLCVILLSIDDFSVAIRAIILTILAADCLITVVKPIRRTEGPSVKATVFIWIFAILCVVVPNYLGSNVNSHISSKLQGETLEVCYPISEIREHNYVKMGIVAKFVLFYVVPLTAIAIFYVTRHLFVVKKTQNKHQQNDVNKEVAITVFMFALMYFICFLPTHVLQFWVIFDENIYEKINIWYPLGIFGFCLKYLNSCTNPIALYFLNAQFRKLFNRYLHCKCEKNQDEQATPMSFQYSEQANMDPTVHQPIVEHETY